MLDILHAVDGLFTLVGYVRKRFTKQPEVPEVPQLPSPEDIERQKRIEEAEELAKRIVNLDRYDGNIDEYTKLKREEGILVSGDTIVPMSTGRPDKFVYDAFKSSVKHSGYVNMDNERELLTSLVEEGCIGLIRHQPIRFGLETTLFRGTPVMIRTPGYKTQGETE